MIIAYTSNDPEIGALADAGRQFFTLATGGLGSAGARCYPDIQETTLPQLNAALRDRPPSAFVFFGHGSDGSPRGLLLRKGVALLGPRDERWLYRGRFIVAMCCYAGSVLGPHVAKQGGALVGFEGELLVFAKKPWADITTRCVVTALQTLLTPAKNTARDVMDAVRKAFETAADELVKQQDFQALLYAGYLEDNAKTVVLHGNPKHAP